MVGGGVVRDRDELFEDGRLEIARFWMDYFQSQLGFTEAQARLRVIDMIDFINEDDEELLSLL